MSDAPAAQRPRKLLVTAGLVLLLAIALSLRLYGLNWDQGGLFHPDERAVLMRANDLRWPAPSEVDLLLDAEQSPLNPRWFNYGSMPIYLLKVVQTAASPFVELDLFDLRLPGRVISALADTVTIALVFAIANRWYGRRTAFIAAALSALAVVQIQLAHFYAFDGLMTTFIVAGVFFSVRVAQEGRARDSALAGLMLGLGLATKFSVAPLALTVLAAHAVYAFSQPGPALDLAGATRPQASGRQWRAYKGLALAAVVAVASLLVAQPYTLIDFKTLSANVSEQSQMVRRIVDYPYTRQYEDTPQYLYQAVQLGVWGLGPVLGIVTWAGFAAGVAVTAVSRRKSDIVIMSWLIPYLLITGYFDVKFMRYMLPAVPFLLIYSARLLSWLGDAARVLWPRRRWLAAIPAVVVVAFTAHYALAFVSMYGGLHPAQSVRDWLGANARPGEVVLQEHWEEGIPNVIGLSYPERLGLYDPDGPQKLESIAASMAEADYFILYSNRLYATIPRLEERYPLSTAFYRALFDGRLGYSLAYTAEKPRTFGGFGYRDDPFARIDLPRPDGWQRPASAVTDLDLGWADESFTVYEHPVSFVFENRGQLDQIAILLAVTRSQSAEAPEARPLGLQLTEGSAVVQRAGGGWSDTFYLRGAPDWLAAVVWFLAAQLMALAALPLAFLVFRSLPDRGYLLAKPLGILLVATVAWVLASLGWVRFSAFSVALAVIVVAVLSAVTLRAYRDEVVRSFRDRWRFILTVEALFAAAFVAFLLIRMANPDLWHPYRGGEKPMDLAYLTAVTKSSVMPPYDPWFAGGYLNYYYFGQFIVASLIRLTGIETQVAYNLAVPLLFALTVAAAFSVVYNLAELTQRARGRPPGSTRSPVLAGLAAVVLVAVAGNIDGLAQLFENLFGADAGSRQFLSFDFWRSSRMMPPDPPGHEITEFPFFTFLFADLHAHLVAIPFAILATGIALSLFVRAGQRVERAEVWVTVFVLGVTTGALRIINTWDYPTAMLVTVLFVGGGEFLARRSKPVVAAARTVVVTGAVAVVGYIVYLPFHQNFELFNNGVEQSQAVTEAWRYLAIHSIFLFVVLGWLAVEWLGRGRGKASGAWAALVRQLPRGGTGAAALIVVAALPVALASTGLGTVALVATLAVAVVATALLAASRGEPGSRYVVPVAAMLCVALLIGGVVDLVTVKGDIGRMNTVFKFYLHAWTLFGLAAAYLLWLLGTRGKLSLGRITLRRSLWLGGLAVLGAGVLVYTVLGTRVRLQDRFSTGYVGLNGAEYMERTTYQEEGVRLTLSDDLEAIEWLKDNVRGSPVIVEGLTDLYRWGNRYSIYTGLPAVVGWDWHQRQQRVDYAWAVTQRRSEVDQFYSSPSEDDAIAMLQRYGVRYVIVGQLEAVYYPPAGLEKFGRMAVDGLAPVFQNGRVTIYEYRPPPSTLAAAR